MFKLLFSPLALLLGAGLIVLVELVSDRTELRRRWAVTALQAGSVALAFLGTWLLNKPDPGAVSLGAWSSLPILTPVLALQGNPEGRILGLGLSAVILVSIILTAYDQDQDSPEKHQTSSNDRISRGVQQALPLLILAAGMLAFLPTNLLTLAIAWALLDGLLALVRLGGGQAQAQRAWLNWGLGTAGTLLLWGASLPLEADHAFQNFSTLPSGGWTGLILVLAAVLRLAPYPFHLLNDRAELQEAGADRPQSAPLIIALQMAPAASAVWLLAQLPVWETLPLFAHQAANTLLLTGLVGSGLLAWFATKDKQILAWILAGQAGMVGLASLGVGPKAALAEGMVLILAGGLFILYTRQKAVSIENLLAAGVGFAALAGFPLTWGGDGRFSLYSNWLQDGWGLYLFLAAGAYLLLLAAGGRMLLRPTEAIAPRTQRIAQGAGLGVLALGLLARSGPLSAANLFAWLAVLLPVGGGALLAWSADSFRPAQVEIAPWLESAVGIKWLAGLASKLGRQVARAIQAIHQVLEGEGALLWVLIVLIIGCLLSSTRGQG